MDKRPSNRISVAILLVVVVALVAGVLIATGLLRSNNTGTTPAQTGTNVEPTQNTYPRLGHAPDYSWVAGQVAFTRIQGGCTYIRSAPAESTSPGTNESTTPGAMIVGTAERSDTSPPLRDITPMPPSTTTKQEPVGDSFVPGGPGWDGSKVKHGDYVVVFGHLAGPDEPREMCPGGRGYVVERMILNP